MLRQQATSVNHILNKLISNLQQAVFDFFVELFVWVDFSHELLKSGLGEELEEENNKFDECKQMICEYKLTTVEFSETEFPLFCPTFPDIEGELCEGDTMSFMSVSID